MSDQPPIQPPPPPDPGGGQAAGPVGPSGRATTEWWKRLVAIILDSLIVGIPSNIIGALLFGSLFAANPGGFDLETGQYTAPSGGFIAGILAAQGAFLLAAIILSAAYFIYFHGSSGQTLGKKVMKIRVVDDTTGGSINYATAFKRWLIPGLVSSFTCGILGIVDGLWPLFDARRQALHDKVADTQVIDVV